MGKIPPPLLAKNFEIFSLFLWWNPHELGETPILAKISKNPYFFMITPFWNRWEEGCVSKQGVPSVRKNGREYVCRNGRGLCFQTRCTFSLYIWKRIMTAEMEEGCIFHQGASSVRRQGGGCLCRLGRLLYFPIRSSLYFLKQLLHLLSLIPRNGPYTKG